MIAALEKHREVPRHLLTKRNIARFAENRPRPAAQRERPPAEGAARASLSGAY